MSGLPEGWLEVPLHEIADVIRGVTYKKEESADASKDGFVAVLRATNITGMSLTFEGLVYVPAINVSTEQLLRTGDVVVASSSGSKEIVGKAGAFARDGFIGSFGAFCTGVRPSPQLSSALFGYYFQTPSYRKSVSALSAGSNINNLKAGDLASQVFPLAPHAEQIRIVAKLEELLSDLDAGVAELKAAQKKLQQYRQSLLKAAVEGALTAPWREAQRKLGTPAETGAQLLQRILTERRDRWEAKQLAKFKEQGKAPPKDWQKKYAEPAAPDTTGLPGLPEDWVWASVEQLSTVVTDGVHKKPNYLDSGVPFLTVKNLTAGHGISFDPVKYISYEDHREFVRRTHPERGDILISKDGTLGVTRVVETDVEFSIFVSIALVKPVHVSLSRYLGIAFSSPVVQRQMTPKGSGLVHIHLEDLRRDCIPLPPLREQEEIADHWLRKSRESHDLEAAIDLSLKQSTAQRQNILRAAFAGQLVPQDPNDEPASVMLERIRAERGARAILKKPRASKARETA